MEQLWRATNMASFTNGGAFRQLPFAQMKKIINLIFGGHDETGRKYGIYLKMIPGQRRSYKFVAYGRLGNIDGWIQSRKDDPFTWWDATSPDLDEATGKKIAEEVIKGNPELVSLSPEPCTGESTYALSLSV
jgi:hypothetical protein